MPHSHARRLAHLAAAGATGRRWRSYLVIAAVIGVATAGVASFPDLALGHDGMGLVLAVIAVVVAISLVSAKNPAMDGRLAEQWSLDGLGKVRGWQVVDNVAIERQDVDHVVISPAAVLAVETRYHSTTHADPTAEARRHRRDLDAAERAAQKIRFFLRSQDLRAAAVVVPVLIVWGPGAPDLPQGHRIDDGVRVVDGNHPELWMHLFETPRLDLGLREELQARFAGYVVARATQDTNEVPALTRQIGHELRSGIAWERSTRSARQGRARATRHRHGLRLAPAPKSTVAPAAASVGAAGATAGTGAGA